MTDPTQPSPEALAAAKAADEKLAADDAAQLEADNKAQAKLLKAEKAAEAKVKSKERQSKAPKIRPAGAPDPKEDPPGLVRSGDGKGRRRLVKPTHVSVIGVRTEANGRVPHGTPVTCTKDEAERLLGLGAIKEL